MIITIEVEDFIAGEEFIELNVVKKTFWSKIFKDYYKIVKKRVKIIKLESINK